MRGSEYEKRGRIEREGKAEGKRNGKRMFISSIICPMGTPKILDRYIRKNHLFRLLARLSSS